MIDIANFQLYGFPVMMYTMIFVTTGVIAYATMNANTTTPSADSNSSQSMAAPAAPAPPAAPQGGGKHKRKTAQKRRSPKKSRSAHTKKHHSK